MLQPNAQPRAPRTKKRKAKLSHSQIMSDITQHKAPLGILNLFQVCPFRVLLDQCTQLIAPTKCTVLILYKREELISHMFCYKGTNLEGHKMPGLK